VIALARARARAEACGAPVAVVEATFRALIAACIDQELARHRLLSSQAGADLSAPGPEATGTSR
jgi:hypothetical protein